MGAITMAEVGVDTRRYFHPQQETMPRERLAALQLARLNATLANACANVPLHRKRLDAAGIGAERIERLGDVARLPITAETDLRDHYPFGMFARKKDDLARLHASSGTTGKPTVVGYTQNDLDHWSELIERSLFAARQRRGGVIR